MSTAKDLMTVDVISVDPDDSVEEAITLMIKHHVSGLPVVDASGRLLGLISEFDLLDLVWNPTTSRDKVYHHMSRRLHTVRETDGAEALAERFRTLSVRRLPVLRHGRLVGIISRHDLLRHVMQARGQIAPVVPQPLAPAAAYLPHSATL